MTPVEQCESLLRAIHAAEVRDDDLDVERLCEEMDAPWYKLTREEQDRLRDLSDKLYGGNP
jgi:hypothetical protein